MEIFITVRIVSWWNFLFSGHNKLCSSLMLTPSLDSTTDQSIQHFSFKQSGNCMLCYFLSLICWEWWGLKTLTQIISQAQNFFSNKTSKKIRKSFNGFWTSFQFHLDFAMTSTKALLNHRSYSELGPVFPL